MIVTHRSLPPLDHFPQRATVLKKVARVCSREKIFLHGMRDNNTHVVQKVCAHVCTELRDKFLYSSPYGQLPGLFRVRYLKDQQICAFRV